MGPRSEQKYSQARPTPGSLDIPILSGNDLTKHDSHASSSYGSYLLFNHMYLCWLDTFFHKQTFIFHLAKGKKVKLYYLQTNFLILFFRLAVSAVNQSAWENVSIFPVFTIKLVSITTFATSMCSKLVCGGIILFSVHETTSL